MGLHQIATFLHVKKKIVTIIKRQPTEWGKISASYSTDKGFLISRIYKELKKNLNSKRTNIAINKWANELRTVFWRKT
jgi:diadenosine tetraphosphate (Ap4A) HIT family hydrolase